MTVDAVHAAGPVMFALVQQLRDGLRALLHATTTRTVLAELLAEALAGPRELRIDRSPL